MNIQDRVKELRRVSASELKPNPRNWRTHPEAQQNALRGVLAEVGFADAVVARELADGTLELVDGHLRAETMQNALVPVLIVDLNDDEANKVLLTHDLLAGMAGVDRENYDSLAAEAKFASAAVDRMVIEATPEAVIEPASESREVDFRETYQVVAECENELEQESLFERLRAEGYKCRCMSL
jgi:ParB-like chromosome segregation protein Spo0J